TLLSRCDEDRRRRFDFLCRAVDVAAALGSDVMSFWSGTPDESAPPDELDVRLIGACLNLGCYAEEKQVRLAFEPEPGMHIDTMSQFDFLYLLLGLPNFGLTLDVGHVHCQGEG